MGLIRVGIVGCGGIARSKHIPNWRRLSGVEIVSACDANLSTLKFVKGAYGLSSTYSDLDSMLKNEKLDIVDICTPPNLHDSQVIRALESGVNVVVEKPMSLTVSCADEMIRSSQKNGRAIFVVHNGICNPGIMKARTWLSEGSIGDIFDAQVDYLHTPEELTTPKNQWAKLLPVGRLGEVLPHPVYLARCFAGNLRVKSVQARHLGTLDDVRFDELRAMFDGEKCPASIRLSFNMPRPLMTVSLSFKKVYVRVDLTTGTADKLHPRSESKSKPLSLGLDALRATGGSLRRLATQVAKYSTGRIRDGHFHVLANAVECLQGRAEPLVSLSEARGVVETCESIGKITTTQVIQN